MPDENPISPDHLLSEADKTKPIHYLEQPGVINMIGEITPELLPILQHASKPTMSNNPDQLERWETAKRLQRIKVLSQSSPEQSLTRQLYEECFGVNATPGSKNEYQQSLAPTVGGLLSHGQSNFTNLNARIEDVVKLNLAGSDLVSVVNNQLGINEKYLVARVVADIAYPPSIHDGFMVENSRRHIERTLITQPEKLSNNQELTNWALRHIRVVQRNPVLLEEVQDPQLRGILNLHPNAKVTKLEFWYMLWSKMSKTLLVDGNYRIPTTIEEKSLHLQATKTLLTIRTHPEFQVLFKFYSPSGYLNQQD